MKEGGVTTPADRRVRERRCHASTPDAAVVMAGNDAVVSVDFADRSRVPRHRRTATRWVVLAEQVIDDHEQIVAMSARAEEAAFVLLALQAPVAGDLRSIVTAIQIVADVDRMDAWPCTSPRLPNAAIASMHYPKKSTVTSPKWGG